MLACLHTIDSLIIILVIIIIIIINIYMLKNACK